MTKLAGTGFSIATGLAIIVISLSPLQAAPLDPDAVKQPKMSPMLNLGKLNYEAKCAECHGKNIAGSKKGPTFLHRVYHPGHHGDGSFFASVRRGAQAHHWPFGNMPAVKGITDAQVKSIILYVRAMQQANGLF